jgi:hypothetical protein
MSFLSMRTRAALKKNKSLRASTPYAQARSFGILFTVEDAQKHHEMKDLLRLLEQDGKQSEVLEFLPRKKENPEFLFDFFSAQDVSIWGEVNSAKAISFAEKPFDYVFYLDEQPNPYMLYLLARSKAHCRVGRYMEFCEPYFEMMIEHGGTTKGLLDNMLKYTRQLR